jgi:hypothetical protein
MEHVTTILSGIRELGYIPVSTASPRCWIVSKPASEHQWVLAYIDQVWAVARLTQSQPSECRYLEREVNRCIGQIPIISGK